MLLPDDPRHGSVNAYTNQKCRCDACKQAWTQAIRKYKDSRIHRLMHDPTLAQHGKYTTYANWGCRCEECKNAWKVYYQKKKGGKDVGNPIINKLIAPEPAEYADPEQLQLYSTEASH